MLTPSSCTVCTEDDGYDVNIKRTITLEVVQENVKTTSKIIRTVDIQYKVHDHRRWPHGWDASEEGRLELEKTKREVERLTNRWIHPSLEVSKGTFVLHNEEIFRGRRGIHSFLKGKVTIEYSGRDLRSLKIVWEIELEEEGPANVDDDPEILPEDARSRSRTRREEHVNDAVEEFGTVLDWFHLRDSRNRTDSGWRRIDRATTNMLEASPPDPICKYCQGEHRNGGCLLRWKYVW